MDIRKAVSAEYSKAQSLKIASFVDNKPQRFEELINIYIAGPYRITQRASWALSMIVEKYPELIIPHLSKLLRIAQQHDAHDAVKRNTMRMLQYVKLPKRFHGRVIELAFKFLQNKREAIAIRVFSMTVLENLLVDKPHLLNELLIIVEDELPYASAAFRSRGNKLLKRLKMLIRDETKGERRSKKSSVSG